MGNNYYARNKNPPGSSLDYLRIETRKMHLKKSLPDFQSKERESSPSYISVESSRVPTEVEYSTKFDQKTTQYELKNMSNVEKRRL